VGPVHVITRFSDGNEFLSNFSESRFAIPKNEVFGRHLQGRVTLTVEHAYQAAKAAEPLEAIKTLGQPTAGQSKGVGRSVALRTDWEDVKVEVMLRLLREKFKDRDLGLQLLATMPAILIEGNHWGDVTWGAAWDGHKGWDPGLPLWSIAQDGTNETLRGRNLLGRCLMVVRGRLDIVREMPGAERWL
jgi:ribA/ribD-fused uncharacterized protein